MKNQMQTDTWIDRTAIILSLILAASITGILVFIFTKHDMPDILAALGLVAGAGLAKLWISPLYRGL